MKQGKFALVDSGLIYPYDGNSAREPLDGICDLVVSNPETKRSKYTTAQIEKVLGKKSPSKTMNKETNAPDPDSKNSPPKSGPSLTRSSSTSENEEHPLLALSRMSLPMAPDVDLATVPLIPVSPSLEEEEEEDPGTPEEQARMQQLRYAQVRRLTVPREPTEQPDPTSES